MLNRVILMGRITRDLEVRQTQSGSAVLSFSVAVDRPVRQGQEKQTDFINCTAWGQRAEFISRYFGKGRMIALEGTLRTGSYDDRNGVKHYTTDVWVDNVSFTGEPKQNGSNMNYNAPQGGYNQGSSYNYNNPAYNNSYNNGGYNDHAPQGMLKPNNNQDNSTAADDSVSIGSMQDFDVDLFNDNGVPF